MPTHELESFTRYKVKTDDTLESVAKKHGLTWQQLAQYNWRTDKPPEINAALKAVVGCTRRTRDGNYMFDSSDDPGVLFIPKKDAEVQVETGQRHRIVVKWPKPLSRVELQVVDPWGHRKPGFAITLTHEETEESLSVTANDKGYAVLRDVEPGRYRVLDDAGNPLFFRIGEKPIEAVLDVRNHSTAISHVITGKRPEGEAQSDRELLAELYTRKGTAPPADNGETTEPPKIATLPQWCVDNLALAAGWKEGFKSVDTARLVSGLLKSWLGTYHPTAIARGYHVVFVQPQEKIVQVFSNAGKALGSFPFKPGFELQGMVGAYALFEDLDANRFVDMATMTYGIDLPTHPTDIVSLYDLVEKPEDLEKVLQPLAREVEIVYLLPTPTQLALIALYGGTGRLEDYGDDAAANDAIHERNLAVCRSMALVYDAYIDDYVGKVKAVSTEDALRELGPPRSPFEMPPPAGSTVDQRIDILDLSPKKTVEPWLAIAHKLDEIYGRKAQGYPFVRFKVKYKADAKAANKLKNKIQEKLKNKLRREIPDLSEKFPGEIEVEIQMDLQVVDGELQVITKGDALIKANLKLNETVKRFTPNNFPVEIAFKQSVGMPEKQTVSVKLGKFQFERDTVGKGKVSVEPIPGISAESEFNSRTGEFGGGLSFKGKDLAKAVRLQASKAKDKAAQLERFASWMEGFELQLMLGFVGTREETILSIVGRAPGFFQRRSIQELFSEKTQWNDLRLDEQVNLATLGWSQESWDLKYVDRSRLPQTATAARSDLSSEEKVSIIALGFATYEEYAASLRANQSQFARYNF